MLIAYEIYFFNFLLLVIENSRRPDRVSAIFQYSLKRILAIADIRAMKLNDNRRYEERKVAEGLRVFKLQLRNTDDAVFIKIRSETVLLGRLCAFASTLR